MIENNKKLAKMTHKETPKKTSVSKAKLASRKKSSQNEKSTELQKTERKSIGSSRSSKSGRKTSSKKTTLEEESLKKKSVQINENLSHLSKKPTEEEKENQEADVEQDSKNSMVDSQVAIKADSLSKDKSSKATKKIPFFLFQPDSNQYNAERNFLPQMRTDREYTLVLDLDETLVHFQEQEDGRNQFLIRPFAQLFLREMSKYYEVVIFTAALRDYADFILDRLDTHGWISHRLYRRHTYLQGNVYQKDLSRLGRELSRTLIVDNNAENFQLQPDNGIYIKSWYDDPDDKALAQLAPLLIGKFEFLIFFKILLSRSMMMSESR